jgi:hypothetical protein
MKIRQILSTAGLFLSSLAYTYAQTTCPPPIPGAPGCYQTSRPNNGNPLTNWPPAPNQECCNAVPLCQPLNFIDNGIIVPEGAPAGVLFPGCVQDELPVPANTCFSNNEKATTWYKWQIRPLPGGPTAPGSPAGKLRFKIIPLDALDDPNYDPATDQGAIGYGETDYDFLLFKIPGNISGNDGAACTAIKNSTIITNNNTVIASCNWTGVRGPTGLFEPGTGTANAQGPAVRFNKPLSVKVGDIFYLAIDNFSVNQQGFYVDFRGLEAPDDSTAIVNPPPADNIKIARIKNPECASKQMVLTFTSPVRCDSVRPEKFTLIGGINPPYVITNIAPEGGCNPGGQDTSFVFTISPDNPDTTICLVVSEEIKDICGNRVLRDTACFRLNYPIPLTFGIVGNQPSCGITKIDIQFAHKVKCDSVKPNKFRIVFRDENQSYVDFGGVTKVDRTNNLPCSSGTLDSLYTLTFSKATIDSTNLFLMLNGEILDKCNNPVIYDTINFRIDRFLSVFADTNKACPKVPINLSAILDSTFNAVPSQVLTYYWRDLTDNQILIESDSVIFTNDINSKVKLIKDKFYPQNATYRVYVLHKSNECLDSADVPVLFAAKPNVLQFSPLAYCFGESIVLKPEVANAKLNELEYSWTRKPQSSALGIDSTLSFEVNDSTIAGGLNQTYVLNVSYLPDLGGCKAIAQEVPIRFGRKISPKINLDSALRFASILPADFVFGNTSSFTPAKFGAQYLWEFGNTQTKTVNGTIDVMNTYNDPGSFVVKLTAYDSLFATPTSEPKICKNTDQIEIGTQNLIPSLVTSNGDGINDNFYIKGMRPNSFNMKLYDRWGKKVAEQTPFEVNQAEESKGGFDVKDIGPGTYYYILTEIRSGKNLVGWISITKEKL